VRESGRVRIEILNLLDVRREWRIEDPMEPVPYLLFGLDIGGI
jgi:hypothetical protein